MTEPSRPDPYDLVFGAESVDEDLFPPIAEEANVRSLPLDDPERFVFLTSVGKLIHAIAGSSDTVPGEEAEARKDAHRQYGRLLFHAFHFWRGGKARRELAEPELRRLLDEVTRVGDWTLRPPAPAGYLRLPRHLVWSAPAEGLQPEPADGVFWMMAAPPDEPTRLHVLLVLGVRGDRPGFSVVPATGVLDHERHWAEVTGREDGPDFETDLPGGELDGLYSIRTPAELLKLVSLAFWELDPASG